MTSSAETFRATAGHFGELVDGVRDEQWDDPTPVDGWAVRDVVGHLTGWLPSFLEHGAGVVIAPGPSVDDDPAGAWRHFQAEVQAVLDDPASADRVVSNPHTGDVPLPQAIDQFFTADVFMHTWDLARATGQDDTLDAQRCAEMYAGMVGIEELLRGSGQYGPAVPVPDDADPQTKLLGFIGRDPQWQPVR